MVDLSSCYFCGAAMDVSLREYPVVPEALAPTADEQETVALCATCQRKLDRVLTPVVGVAQRHAAEAATRSDDGQPNPDAADAVTQAEPERDDGDDEDLEQVVPADLVQDAEADDATTDAGDDPATDAGDDDGPPFEVDDTTSVFDDQDDASDDDGGTDSIFSDGTTTIADDTESDHGASGLGDGITIDDADNAANAGNTGQQANSGGNAGNTGQQANSGGNAGNTGQQTDGARNPGTTQSTQDDAEDATPDVDPRTYNKVVRLLKNRDLPVPRSEIEAVAGSAYDIPDPECETIIDAAIQRGLVAERDGHLIHPDGV